MPDPLVDGQGEHPPRLIHRPGILIDARVAADIIPVNGQADPGFAQLGMDPVKRTSGSQGEIHQLPERHIVVLQLAEEGVISVIADTQCIR